MKFTETGFKGLIVYEPDVFGDERGFFMETYNRQVFFDNGIRVNFIQDNHSKSQAGILRGLHFQERHQQAKLVRVATGAVFDVVVDLRKQSSTFGQTYSIVLSTENKRMLFVPKGFAHGFQAIQETDFLYKVSNVRFPEEERGINPLDKTLNIEWPIENPQLNKRDATWPTFNEVAGIKIRR